MFKLQRLEITGFKSFADYTEIVFTGSGITAVVGPNGCGKSNVADCIAWVLGEQRAKSLRGEDMKDVVFQGTKNRKPSGMAEVILHLVRDEESSFGTDEDNLSDIDETLNEIDENAVVLEEIESQNTDFEIREADTSFLHPPLISETNNFHAEEIEVEKAQAAQIGSIQTVQKKVKAKRHWRPRNFALDFAPGEAVSVTRRLYLSGESEYLLNGKTCRLRDIQDLFAGTGLSGAHYALIEQGKIGQILSSKPSDRRNLIEEAAGISKFRTRQRAAEARLESAKTNLSRISDIVSEIEKQVNTLRRQAAKTRRYKILREELRQLLRQVFSTEGKHLTELVDELEKQLDAAQKAERKIFWDVAEKDDAFREGTQKAREAEENLSELRSKHSENALQRDRSQRERIYKEELIANLTARFAVLKSEIETTEQRIKVFKSEIERLKKDERKELVVAEKAETTLREAEKKYQARVSDLRQIETELETERAAFVRHAAAVERFGEIERQLEYTIERLKERLEGLQREGERAEETFAEHAKEAKKLETDLKAEREKLSKLQTEKQELLIASNEARTVLQTSEKNLNDLREDFSRTKHRLEALRELDEKRAIYTPTVQKLFAEQKQIGVKFLGTLADEFEVEERAERAVENLFGAFLQTVLVETKTEVHRVIKYLKENNLGRIGILVFNAKTRRRKGAKEDELRITNYELRTENGKRESAKPNGQIANRESQIANFLGVSNEFAELLTDVFPREMSSRLVENLDEIETEENFATFEGDLIVKGKLFVSGNVQTNEKNNSLLAFKRELRTLKTEGEKLSREIEKAERETEKSRLILSEKENEIVDLQSLIVKIERELLGLEIQEKSIRQEIERAERHKKVVAEETKQIERELAETRKKQTEAETNAAKAEKARIDSSEKLAKISQKLNDARSKTEAENAVLNEKRTSAATSAERRRSAQIALRRVENELKELENRIARQNLELSEIKGKQKDLTASIAEIERRNASAESELETEQDELAEAAAHLKLARERADSTSTALAELNKKSAEARNERAALEIRQAEAVTKLRNLNEKSLQELNLPLIELVEKEKTEDDFDLTEARERLEDLRDKLENFGAINMLALEELAEIEERLLFLTSQRQDIIDGINAAEEALREIKERSRERFKNAFAAINHNFAEFFQELFGGGRGEMTLLEAEDVLEAGIEIVAQPPGKRLQNILLLSGGEKAMTAIALILAIFRFRPAPFCLLDEVDAPLDDANVGRFVNKIAEMSEKTQFIVITHNKRTMEAAKALYGVTMQEAGVSKVVSVRFE
ncbi:MAG: chromosome segregation protein SMC [Pyrinomonadaceae bacterium]